MPWTSELAQFPTPTIAIRILLMVKIGRRQLADFMAVEQTQIYEKVAERFSAGQAGWIEFLLRNGMAAGKNVNAARRMVEWVPDRPGGGGPRRGAAALWHRGSNSGCARTQPGYRHRGEKS